MTTKLIQLQLSPTEFYYLSNCIEILHYSLKTSQVFDVVTATAHLEQQGNDYQQTSSLLKMRQLEKNGFEAFLNNLTLKLGAVKKEK